MRVPGLLLVLVVALPALAGCVNDSPSTAKEHRQNRAAVIGANPAADSYVAMLPDGSIADETTLNGLTPLSGVQRFIGGSSFEPTIGSDGKGNLYMVAGVGNVRASKDHGATWQDVTAKFPVTDPRSGQPLRNPPNSNDPFVYVDQDTGRVYTSDLQALVCSWMSWSDDQAATWTTNPMDCGLPPGVHDHQSIATGKSRGTPTLGYPKMMYYCVNRVGDSSCSASVNGGLSFGPLIPVLPGVDAEAGQLCGGLTGHVKTDHAGRVYLGKNQCGVPTVAVSEDDGKTWTVHQVTHAVSAMGHDVETAADASDNIYAFWIGDNGLPYLAVSRDHATTWSHPTIVAPPSLTATYFGAIAAKGTGKIAFEYIGTDHPGGYKSQNATAWKGAEWHGYIGVITNALDASPVILTTRVDPQGDPIARGQCPPGRCNGMGDFFDITIDPEGRPWAAMVDVCTKKCVTDGVDGTNDSPSIGFAGTLATGPSLLDAGGALPALPPVALAAT